MTEISRRPPPQLAEFSGPAYYGADGWDNARGSIYRFLRWVIQNYSGIPGGFKSLVPLTVLVGGTASPGSENNGWMSAGAQLVVAAGSPVAVSLGQPANTGTSTAGSRGDHQHDTIILAQQVRALVSLRVG